MNHEEWLNRPGQFGPEDMSVGDTVMDRWGNEYIVTEVLSDHVEGTGINRSEGGLGRPSYVNILVHEKRPPTP